MDLPPDQRLPFNPVAIQWPQEKEFNGAAGRLASQQTSRDHPGIIRHQPVAHVQIITDITEMAMGDPAGGALQHQQAAAVARFGRLLRYKRRGQFIVKEREMHR
jgi:hypothetical protein